MDDRISLPAELRARAEARAAEAGVTLEEFVAEAVEDSLRLSAAGNGGRAKIPLIPGRDRPELRLSNAEIEELLT